MKQQTLFAAFLIVTCAATQAAPIVATAYLSGPAESPPVNSPGTGFTVVTYDAQAHTLRVQASFTNLLAATTASHIHAPVVPPSLTAGVATETPSFSGFPLGVTSGQYDHTFDLTQASSYSAGFLNTNGGLATAEARLVAAIVGGAAYLNIHTTLFPAGEIRGFLAVDSDADGVPDSVDAFPNSRDVGTHIMIEGCDTGVANVLFADGSTISDLVYDAAADARNHGAFVSAVAKLKNQLRKSGVITAAQAEAIQSCAGTANLP